MPAKAMRFLRQKLDSPGGKRVLVRRWLLVSLLCLLFSCDGKGNPNVPGPVATVAIDPATAGTIVASVLYQGDLPPRKPIVMRSAPQCANLHSEPVLDPSLLVENGYLVNAVVWVEEGLGHLTFPAPKAAVVIDQKGCLYVPRVAVAMVGQPVEFRNSDPEPHNVHSKPKLNRGANFMLSRAGLAKTVTFHKSEVTVPVGCDVHPWMAAYVAVLSHPYGAVTPSSGPVRLEPLPAGQYTVAAWHERLGTARRTVEVRPGQETSVEFVFGPS